MIAQKTTFAISKDVEINPNLVFILVLKISYVYKFLCSLYGLHDRILNITTIYSLRISPALRLE